MKNDNQNDYRFLDDPEAHARRFVSLLYDDDELLGLFVLGAGLLSKSRSSCYEGLTLETLR